MKKSLKVLLIFVLAVLMQTSITFADVNYPISTNESEHNGYITISKTYALDDTENPSDINISNFERYGIEFAMSEIVKTDHSSNDIKLATKEIEIITKTNKIEKILSEIEDSIEYDEDGYKGILTVDNKSITTVINSSGINYGTASIKREYYNLPNQDISHFSKSITSNGATYNYNDVKYTTNLDGSYNANVTYTRKTSSAYVETYLTKVTYQGEVSKLLTDKTMYTVKYLPLVVEVVEDNYDETVENNNLTETKSMAMNEILMLAFKLCILAVILGGLVYLSKKYLSRNVKVFNREGRDYRNIGKLVLDLRKPELFVNLNYIPKEKLTSNSFVVEIPKKVANATVGKPIYFNFRGQEREYIIQEEITTSKYQIDVEFLDEE